MAINFSFFTATDVPFLLRFGSDTYENALESKIPDLGFQLKYVQDNVCP